MDDCHAALGRCLRQWRTVRRLKQSHVAELLGVSQGTVSRWESGVQAPAADERAALLALLAARLDTPGDRQLARLVESSTLPVHLICDLTHRLLACSEPRARQLQRDVAEMIGVSLWPAATPEIEAAEAGLAARGWYDGRAVSVEADTRGRRSPLIDIAESRFRWTRLRLSDGRFVRLVETVSAA